MARNKLNAGFTLVEFLIVILMTILLIGGGISAYLSLNDRYILINAGKLLTQEMRAAQKKARAGDKPTGIQCDKLYSYNVSSGGGAAASISLSVACLNGGSSTPTTMTPPVETFQLPNGVTLSSSIDFRFLSLQGGVTNPGTVTLTQGNGHSYSFVIDGGGSVTEGTYQ